MNITLTGQVIQAKRYNMDGNKGAALYMTQKSDGTNEDLVGLEIMKLAAPYEVVEQLREHLPCNCEIVAQPVQGAGQKMSFKVLSIKPVTSGKPASNAA
ncbi:hypothetical protein [Marinobacterium sedimentorum]|uniref:hypothetical protein n=1 Tax=Marinobacterium sedimentorum TaxID=2927804 RepID=UPI0020C6DE4C|nr:hypothetical protein [Marinobacterium sedimentorum]MCP8686072.1 hypothetical protein [Marinobacterium sedimentorum]